jgi:hypothetical protein
MFYAGDGCAGGHRGACLVTGTAQRSQVRFGHASALPTTMSAWPQAVHAVGLWPAPAMVYASRLATSRRDTRPHRQL